MNNTTTDLTGDEQKWTMLFIAITTFVVVLWVVFAAIPKFYDGGVDATGPWGDTYGALNTLFSGLAFAAIVVTLLMQRHDLRIQQRELKLSRDMLEKQIIEARESKEHLQESARAQRMLARATALSGEAAALVEVLTLATERGNSRRIIPFDEGDINPQLDDLKRRLGVAVDEMSAMRGDPFTRERIKWNDE